MIRRRAELFPRRRHRLEGESDVLARDAGPRRQDDTVRRLGAVDVEPPAVPQAEAFAVAEQHHGLFQVGNLNVGVASRIKDEGVGHQQDALHRHGQAMAADQVEPSRGAHWRRLLELELARSPQGDAVATRRCFRWLAGKAAELGLRELSMGMSDDFEVAIAEGATLVRVGTAIFGRR